MRTLFEMFGDAVGLALICGMTFGTLALLETAVEIKHTREQAQ